MTHANTRHSGTTDEGRKVWRPRRVAVVDESVAELSGGLCYVVASVVTVDLDALHEGLGTVLPAGRSRPFHWRKEGPTARRAMVDLLGELRPSARLLVRSTHRRGQVAARATLLESLVLDLIGSIDELVIESRTGAEDERDRNVLLDTFRTLDLDETPPFVYRWTDKAERLIWVADAVAGIAREHLIETADPAPLATSTSRSDSEEPYLAQLRAAGVVGELEFPT